MNTSIKHPLAGILALAGVALSNVLLCATPALGTVTFNLTAGYLRQNATTPLPTGSLLLMVVAGGNNGTSFTSTVPAGQFVSGGDTILAAAAFNTFGDSASSTTKATTSNSLRFTIATGQNPGAYVELRWYPGITLTQYQAGTTPTAGMLLGEYNPLATNLSGNTTLNPDGGSTWTLPSDGSTSTLNFLTQGRAGTQAEAEGFTNFAAGAAVIPEPSTFVLSGLIMLGAGWKLGRKRRLAA